MPPTTELLADPELNALIATTIMGLEWGKQFERRQPLIGTIDGRNRTWAYRDSRANKPIAGRPINLIGYPVKYLPDFSGHINGAWLVVEKLTAEGWGHKHHVFSAAAEMPGWSWTFMRPGGGAGASFHTAEADTAPLAICKAALAAYTNQ